MKTKLLFLFLLFCGMYQYTSAFNVSTENCYETTESSNFFTLDSFTFADDATDITITVNGSTIAATYNLYIDTDNNAATGDPNNGGADFRIENDAVNRWTGGTWVWEWHSGNVVITNDPGVSRTIKINRSYLPLLNSGSQINVSFTNTLNWLPDGDPLPLTGMESYTTTSGTPPPNLDSLTITENDATTLTFTVLGSGIEPTYDIYIDTDNNTATGLSTRAGADVLIQNGLSYQSQGTGWAWAEHTTTAVNSVTDVAGVSREIVLDRTILGLAGSSVTFNVIYENSGGATDALPSLSFTTGTLSVDNLALSNVSIYKTNRSTLSIKGLSLGKSNIKLFDMLGKQVLDSSFTLNGKQDVSIPYLTTGVYIVRLKTESGTLNKKIIL